MRLTLVLSVLVALASPAPLSAQSGPAASSAEPFKVGTFEVDGYQRVGIVLRDRLVVELDAANRALEGDPDRAEVARAVVDEGYHRYSHSMVPGGLEVMS